MALTKYSLYTFFFNTSVASAVVTWSHSFFSSPSVSIPFSISMSTSPHGENVFVYLLSQPSSTGLMVCALNMFPKKPRCPVFTSHFVTHKPFKLSVGEQGTGPGVTPQSRGLDRPRPGHSRSTQKKI